MSTRIATAGLAMLCAAAATILLAFPPIAHASNKDGLIAFGDPFGELPITIPQYTKIQFQLDFTKVPPFSHCPTLPGNYWNTWYDVLFIPTNGAAAEVYPDYLYPPPNNWVDPSQTSQGPCDSASPTPNTENGTTYMYNAWYPPSYTFNTTGNYNLTYGLYAAHCDWACQYWFSPTYQPPPVFGTRGLNDANTLNWNPPAGGFPLGGVGGDFYYWCYRLDDLYPSNPPHCAIDKTSQDSGNYVVHVANGVPSGANQFNAVEPGTLNTSNNTGPIYTQVAGRGYTLNLWIFNQNGKPENNPDQTVEIYLYDAHDNSGTESPAGSGCLSTWNKVADLGSFTFNGSDPVAVTLPAYADALPDARLYILQTGGKGPTGSVSCSTDDFAVRPAYFAIQPTDENWTTAGTARALNASAPGATPVHKAGRPFTLTLVPKNAAGNTVTGYGSPGAPNLVAVRAVAPTTSEGGVMGALSSGTFTVPPASVTALGEAVSSSAAYSEVGAVGLEATDEGFAVVDAGDGTPACQRTIGETCPNGAYWSPPTTAGRFVPDHFAISKNVPQFTTFCPVPGSATGGFTYVGQPFDYTAAPAIDVTAENAGGGTTRNYADFPGGSWFRLTASDLMRYTAPSDQYADANGRSLDTAGLPDPDVTVTPTTTTRGTGSITFTLGTAGIDYTRNSATAPFAADIDLSQKVEDLDHVQASPSATVTFANIAWDAGNTMRYGRLALQNAYGSELMALRVPMTVQYYAGTNTGFVDNALDHCTTGLRQPVALGPYTGNLTNGSTTPTFSEPPATGSFGLSLSAPGAGNTGSVRISVQAAAGQTLSWLKYDWTSATAPQTFPTALAVFGVYNKGATTVFTQRVGGGGR